MTVHKLTDEQIEKLTKSRADWGHEKYGDRDEFRDGSLDMLEEVMDIINILQRRLMWLDKQGLVDDAVRHIALSILEGTANVIFDIQDFDKIIRVNGYQVNDTNGGERIGIDKL